MRNALLSLTFVLALSSAASACPMCKDSAPNDESSARQVAGGGPNSMDGNAESGNGAGFPTGLNTSVYVMLAGFFGSLGLVGYTIAKGMRTPAARVPRPTPAP